YRCGGMAERSVRVSGSAWVIPPPLGLSRFLDARNPGALPRAKVCPRRWRWVAGPRCLVLAARGRPKGPEYLSPAQRAGNNAGERTCGLKGRDTVAGEWPKVA
ncbi:MAG TPA: hypothetical protein VNZ64_08240, partial [Candidatus Acidoferrum sp.]|nr:hypothetical protein [Candidatus Acidoferrum sp.]